MSEHLERILRAVAHGELSPDDAVRELRQGRGSPVGDFAVVDHDRAARCGVPEVVLCEGKEIAQIPQLARAILERAPRVLLTRIDEAQFAALQAELPAAVWHRRARCATVDPAPLPRRGHVAIVAAGTADLPVAEEARVTLEHLGAHAECHYDVGVAGLHRLLERLPRIREAQVVIAVAGMEGALASVVAGQVRQPVIAVPTSIGYGVNLAGITPLLTMLTSCAAGVGVVNIDNGFGAGYLAAQINRLASHQAP